MFAFRKKNKNGEKTEQLLRLVKKDPDNVKNRLRLADQYLRTGDRKSAIVEYRFAAQYLEREAFNLKAISIYKKLFSLEGMSLSDYKSLAAIYSESGLFVEARKTYREILRIEPKDQETLTALKKLEEEGEIQSVQETENPLEETETLTMDDSDAVPIETLLTPSEEEIHSSPSGELMETEPERTDAGGLFEDSQMPSEIISEDHAPTFEIDLANLQPDNSIEMARPIDPESPTGHDTLQGKMLPDMDLSNLTEDTEGASGDTLPEPEKDSEIDLMNPQVDDFPKTTRPIGHESPNKHDVIQEKILPDMDLNNLSDDTEGASIDLTNLQLDDILQTEYTPEERKPEAGPSALADAISDLTEETLNEPPDPTEEEESVLPGSSGPGENLSPSPSSQLEEQLEVSEEDPDLHYHLGVAYREMDLTDRAIEEFTNALERGNKSLECLTMLAKCYFEKGLFQESAAFIHSALKLDNLTQDQIDQLHRQLEEAEAVGKLG